MKIILTTTMVIRISHHIIETLNLYYHIKLSFCWKREVVNKLLQNSFLFYLYKYIFFSEIFSRSFFNLFFLVFPFGVRQRNVSRWTIYWMKKHEYAIIIIIPAEKV